MREGERNGEGLSVVVALSDTRGYGDELSGTIEALPSVVLLSVAGLSASDAMESEADLWEI